MRKKRIGFLLSVLMAILTLFVLGSTAHAKEISVSGLDANSAQVYDKNGQLMPPSSLLNTTTSYQVTYNWQIPDSEVLNAGDTVTVGIPANVKVQNNVSFPVVDPDGVTIGTFTYKAGDPTGTITFNDRLSGLQNRHGTLTINANGNSTISGDERSIAKSGSIFTSDEAGSPTTLFWHITVQPGNNPTIVITDTLGPNQTFLPDTVQAYLVNVVNGMEVPGRTVTPTVAVDGNIITFSFTNVTSKLVLNYRTKPENVDPAAGNVWHNTASLNGLDVAADADIVFGGNGSAQQDYSVRLTKHDADTQAVLAGATYELQDSTGKVLQSGLTTDANGQLIVEKLAAGNYQFVETKAPEGYELNTKPLTFTLGTPKTLLSIEVSQDDQKTPVVPATGDVTLTKTDATTKKVLAGAVYELRDANGKVLQSNLKTDAAGQLTVTGLTAGDYQFVETAAPTGYGLNATPLPFTIKAGQTAAVTVSATDEPVTNPSQPGEPGQPEEPGKPSEPGTTEPGQPEEPGKPSEPGTTEPGQPEEPGKPSEPGTTEPGQPEEPGKPSEPGTTEPGQPEEPGKPSEPGTTEPGQPEEPGKPSKPGTTEPGQPGQPSKPGTTEPSQPSKPGTTEPGQPSQPGTTGPSTPSQPSVPGTTTPSTPSQPSGTLPTNPSQPGVPAPSLPGAGNPSASQGVTTSNGSGTLASGTGLNGTTAGTGTTGAGAGHGAGLPQTSETPTSLLMMLAGLLGLLMAGTGVVYLRRRHG
ncbi:SpaA isopeptide-forming pilin-related protein [Lactiplantibacillus pentosus]|uniref:SpaA isopeptide-forming pilin-related protein n=1 Tax=Lactiplantibacillus pentosus TaxID=1589 RepID=UPI001ADD98F7|nr:SpaA isopeptide-forming pilin-related protein [Lactiplantibacillus pentosus]MBO9164719.1 LPXTG cell wall anchor domain-containing protein [Lactiplantibacillus pentosus]